MRDIGNKKVMATNIKRYMDKKRITAKDLSKALNVPYTTVLSWIKAEYYPRIDKIEKMSDYFGILKSDLIEEKMTEEKEKDNDVLADIIVRLRSDEEFKEAVKALYSLDSVKINGVIEMLKAFQK